MHGSADARPGRRLFGDDRHIGMLGTDQAIELVQEVDGLEVFAATELVGDPLTGLP